uniref:Uncharacterized protein n=1 Tax=Biomphalaria glabrata TaxID=6526 RepID=A0A2C9LXG5_BIOGL
MGQIYSVIARPFRNFNIENRAFKVLEKRKTEPHSAPKHPTTVKILSRVREENPELFKKEDVKHEQLNENLKKVFVESKDPIAQPSTEKKSLPISRHPFEDSELGVMDVDYPIPEGKATLRTVFNFLGQHRLNPEQVTASSIAAEHKLDLAKVEHVLNHFKIFNLYIPDEMMKTSSMRKAVQEQLEMAKSHPGFIHVPGVPKLAEAIDDKAQTLNSNTSESLNTSGTKT